MSDVLRKRYWAVTHDQPEANEQLHWEYDQWSKTIDAAYEAIKLFHELTGGYPVIGDELHVQLPKPAYRSLGLHITKRIVYSVVDSDRMQISYTVEAADEEMEELEEYQEGDLVENED